MSFSSALLALATGIGFREKAAPKNPHAPISFGSLDAILESATTFTPPRRDASTLLGLYNTNPWVRSIVGRVGSLVARQPWYIADAEGNEIGDHPAIDFLKQGGPGMSGGQSLRLTAIHYDLAGEAFWIIGRDPRGRPASFAVIPPNECMNTPYAGFDFFEFARPDGRRFQVPSADVIWFRDPDPLDPYGRGRSLTGAAATELATDEAASEHVLSHLQNRARPDFIVSGTKDAPMGPNDMANLASSWRQKFSGKGNGKPLFSGQPITVSPVSSSLKDTEMAALRPELRAIITEIYGVPPEVFGRVENSNRATIESADFLLATHTIDPRLWALCEVLAPFVAREFQLPRGQTLAYVSPIKKDRAFQLSVMQIKPGVFTGDEFRALADHEPLGLDELEPEPDPADTEPDPADEADTTDEQGKHGGNRVSKNSNDPVASPGDIGHTDGAAYTDGSKKALTPADVVDVSAAHEDPQVKATVTGIIDQLYKRLIERYGIGLLAMLEQDANFAINSKVADWLATEIPHLLDGVDKTTRDALKAAMVTGAANDEAVKDLIDRIENVFRDAATNRASLISQTEATKLAGFSAQTAAEQAGFERKMWLSSSDQKVRSAHAAMDGQTRNITEPFNAPDGSTAMYPGAFGKASQDINCRCAVRPVLADETKAFGDEFPAFHNNALDRMAADIERSMRQIFGLQKARVIEFLKARAN